MTDLAKLVVRLEAQSSQLLTELEKANRKIDRFASATTKTLSKWANGLVGFFSAKYLLNFSSQVLKAEGDLVAMAEQAGSTVERVSSLGYAASQSASDLEGLTKGLGELSNRAADAAEKGGSSAAAFTKLGINVKNADGSLKNSADLLLEISDQFAKYQDGAAKSALAQDLFGKSGRELIPLLNRGAAGIEELTKKAEQLGITVSTEAAEAANEFNDQLSTLGNITRGIVGEALSEIVPILTEFNDGLINSEDAAARADKAARVLAAGLKLLLSAGVIVGEIFDRVGTAIGAAAAALVAVAQGEFRRAFEIIKESNLDTIQSAKDAGTDIAAIWTATADQTVKAAEDADKKLKKTLMFGGGDGVQEVTISAKKIEKGAIQQFYDDLDEMTKTSSENAQSEYNKQKEALEALYEAGRISLDEYNDRLGESFDKFLPEFDVTVKKINDAGKKAADELNEFQKEAARNTQDIIAEGLDTALHDGVSKGAKGALDAFGDMLEKMALQALAANIAGKIFGSNGGAGDDGWIDTAFKAFGSFFGGGMDAGGRGSPGVAYAIGRGAQPEMFVPDQPGTFIPRDEWMANGGGRIGKLEQNIYVQGRADMHTARQLQIEASRRQRTATARLG